MKMDRLDLVVGAVHYRFDLPRAKQTERVLRAKGRRRKRCPDGLQGGDGSINI